MFNVSRLVHKICCGQVLFSLFISPHEDDLSVLREAQSGGEQFLLPAYEAVDGACAAGVYQTLHRRVREGLAGYLAVDGVPAASPSGNAPGALGTEAHLASAARADD